MLTKAEFTELALRAQQDPRPLIEGLFDIMTKQLPGQQPIQRLKFNRPQILVHERLMAMRKAGLPPRGLLLKARQFGGSTQASGYVSSYGLCHPYATAMQIAHAEEPTIVLFKKIQFMFERLPGELRPKLLTDRRDELTFDKIVCADGEIQLRSTVSVAYAGGEERWRSKTIQCLHISELAQMGNRAEDVYIGALAAVPPTPTSLVLIESTARGVGNVFHEEWQRAESGQSEFAPIFVSWFDIEENWLKPPEGFEPTPEEREIAAAFGLNHGQLQWRRYKLYTEARGNVDLFNQEHPPTPADAFIMSGRPAFDIPRLRTMRERALTLPVAVGIFTSEHGFTEYARGPLRVYEKPVEGHDYVLGADPSAGVEGGDPSSLQVFDRMVGRQVACWSGLAKPQALARIARDLGTWYNTAMIAPELNGGWGHTMVEELKALLYPNLYVWRRLDRVTDKMSLWLGWQTTFISKQWLIDTLAFGISEGDILLQDIQTIQQCIEFQYFEGSTAEGAGAHDDDAMAMMIAFRVHIETPMKATGLPPRVQYEDPRKPDLDQVPMPPGEMNRDAWTDADSALGNSRQTQRLQDEIFQPDDDELGRGELPPGIDHPW